MREVLLSEQFGQLIVSRLQLRLMIFDEAQETILQWIEPEAAITA